MESILQYCPSDDEVYMNPDQIRYFKEILLQKRQQLADECSISKSELKNTELNVPDIFDVASKNTELALDFEVIDRNRKNLVRIDKALAKIHSGEYGYCELTGEEIGVKRLQAQPTATLCLEAKEMLERQVHMRGYSSTGYISVV